jgi:hypothetical protein
MGASGAVFGLFVVGVLTKLRWDAKKLLEGAILGQFVLKQVLQVRLLHFCAGARGGGGCHRVVQSALIVST